VSSTPFDSPGDEPLATDVQVARWQAGDEAAFAILYKRFAPLIETRIRRSRVLRGLRATYQVEDIVQEAWMRVVPAGKRSFTPRGPGSFLAFVASVTDHAMVDLLRRATTSKRGEGRTPQPLTLGEESDSRVQVEQGCFVSPTSAARCSELKSLAERVLQEREHLAWRLVELEGYTPSEAALALDASDSAVRGLLLRSRARLAVALDSKNEE
jgi:RNA polymerase sigma factor (sigma-70 family)